MKISLAWIRELLPTLKASPEAICDRLTGAGIEVEAVVREADSLEGVIVGEVRSLALHPDADKLQVASVFDGEEVHSVVCGAPNVAVGQKVALARPGATLANGVTIQAREIRGVPSAGMLCSEKELGLSLAAAGILVLSARAKPGKPLSVALGRTDVILELATPPNRPDILSHLGVARELSALFELPRPKLAARPKERGDAATKLAKVKIEVGSRCPRYLARVIEGVTIGPSPDDLVRRLEALGLRSISNVVDATNLVLMELGHPLHAFDLDRLHDQRIVVRLAKPGETIVTLDGVTRKLDEDDLVIADGREAVAIAGVMGGGQSEVGSVTSRILLESALFDPASVRRTAKRHGLHSEASHRFERGADPEALELALDRCATLIISLAGGEIRPGRVEVEKRAHARKVVALRPERASAILGRQIERAEIRQTLGALGLAAVPAPKTKKVPSRGKKGRPAKPASDVMHFEVPSCRVDLVSEIDLIEELARVGGYHRIPTVLPAFEPAAVAPKRDDADRLRDALAGLGFNEAISLAFNSRAQLAELGFTAERAVEVANPLGEESALMRRSMLPALLKAARHNQSLMRTDLRLFEIGHCFEWASPPGELPIERHTLGILMRGRRSPRGWSGEAPELDVFDLKGVLEALLELFDISNARFVPVERGFLHPRSSGELEAGGKAVGLFGELHPDLLGRLDLAGPPVLIAEVGIKELAAAQGARALFRPLARFPAVTRDLSFFLDRSVSAERLLEVVRGAAGQDLEATQIFDVYEGRGVPPGRRSLAVSLAYRAAARTLTDREVDEAQAAVMAALERGLGAEIRKGP